MTQQPLRFSTSLLDSAIRLYLPRTHTPTKHHCTSVQLSLLHIPHCSAVVAIAAMSSYSFCICICICCCCYMLNVAYQSVTAVMGAGVPVLAVQPTAICYCCCCYRLDVAYHSVTAMVGAGVLGLPAVFGHLGWPGGIIMLVFSFWVRCVYGTDSKPQVISSGLGARSSSGPCRVVRRDRMSYRVG